MGLYWQAARKGSGALHIVVASRSGVLNPVCGASALTGTVVRFTTEAQAKAAWAHYPRICKGCKSWSIGH